MPRKTKYVRVKVDLILHFKEERDTLPVGLGEIVTGLGDRIAERFAEATAPKPSGWSEPIGYSDCHVSQSLYFPPKQKEKVLAGRFKKKVA